MKNNPHKQVSNTMTREEEIQESKILFKKEYGVMKGVIIASILGGFVAFGFVMQDNSKRHNQKLNQLKYESRTKDSLYREANTRLINHKNKCNCVCL
jgi:hypothetical protein